MINIEIFEKYVDSIDNIDNYVMVPTKNYVYEYGIVNLNTAEVYAKLIRKNIIKKLDFKTYETIDNGFFTHFQDLPIKIENKTVKKKKVNTKNKTLF